MGYSTQVKQLADFHDAYGLEADEEEVEEEDEEGDSAESDGSYESDEDE
jgi:hypothetical protein